MALVAVLSPLTPLLPLALYNVAGTAQQKLITPFPPWSCPSCPSVTGLQTIPATKPCVFKKKRKIQAQGTRKRKAEVAKGKKDSGQMAARWCCGVGSDWFSTVHRLTPSQSVPTAAPRMKRPQSWPKSGRLENRLLLRLRTN